MLRIDDVRAYRDRAEARGGLVVMEPTEFAYGERQWAIQDPWGHVWTLSETIADAAPEEWGGVSITPP